MNALKSFFKTTLMGGILVVLPVGLCLFLTVTIYQYLTVLIAPLTALVIDFGPPAIVDPETPPPVGMEWVQPLLNNVIVIGLLLGGCFCIGLVVRTSLGSWIYTKIETRLLKRVPMYSLIKDIVVQFIGNKKSPFSSVARVRLFHDEISVTAFVTDSQPGLCTVFVPTGPNPTSGNIYHVPEDRVTRLSVTVEEAMRSIISCGAGSSKLLAEKPADT